MPISDILDQARQERHLASRLLAGEISVFDVIKAKDRKMMFQNIIMYALEQANCTPGATPGNPSQIQIQAALLIGDALSHRKVRHSAASYLYLLSEPESRDWRKWVMSNIAVERPKGALYLLEFKPEEYCKTPVREASFKADLYDHLSEKAREALSHEAKRTKKLPLLYVSTSWQECRKLMLTGRDRSHLLAIEIGSN